jgi:hypothetical protein
MTIPYWHRLEPFVYFEKVGVPWRPQGSTCYSNFVKAIEELNFQETALMKEGPKSLVRYCTD